MFNCCLLKRSSCHQKRISAARSAAFRYVSTYASHRIRFAVHTLLSTALFFSAFVYAENRAGDVLELSQEAVLFEGADRSSQQLGKLPKGTVLQFKGETENDFSQVRVELVNGEIEGWVENSKLKSNTENQKTNASNKTNEVVEQKKKKPLKRAVVPQDEGILLRRDPSFIYGLALGPTVSIITTQYNENLYNGVGFYGGALVGFFLNREWVLRAEAGYSLLNGAGVDGTVSFGIFDLGAYLEFLTGQFALFGGLKYGMGLGVGDIPRPIAITGASDVSSLWGELGAGFRIPAGDVTAFVIRGKYGFAFVRAPVALQSFGLTFYLEVRG